MPAMIRRNAVSPQELAAQASASQLQQAQVGLDNNIAVAKELETRGARNSGLLSRANDIAHMTKSAQPDSFQANRVAVDRKRLLQDSGMNVSAIDRPQMFQQPVAAINQGDRAQIRQRRSRA